MKIFPYVVFGVLSVSSVLGFAASNEMNQAQVSVVGTAMKEVTPDITRWSISVFSEGKQTSSVAQEEAKRIEAVLAFLSEQNIPKSKIKTESMRLNENWEYANGKRSKQGYIANSQISFESDIASYQKFWTGLSALEGIRINGTNFDFGDKKDIEKQVRTDALLAAKRKASAMAKVLDASIGKPIYIEDMNGGDDIIQPMQEMRAKGLASVQQEMISPGSLQIRMRVKVIFELK